MYIVHQLDTLLFAHGVNLFIGYTDTDANPADRDSRDLLCEYVEFLWLSGGNHSEVRFLLSAVQFYLKRKHIIPAAWTLWSTWHKPWQAPPLPAQAWGAWVEYSLLTGHPHFAALLLLGFAGMLRIAELLNVKRSHLTWSEAGLVISLMHTKSGMRFGKMETVVLREPLICDWVFRLIGHLAP
eukprot:6474338-Amphidinium_carterae.4